MRPVGGYFFPVGQQIFPSWVAKSLQLGSKNGPLMRHIQKIIHFFCYIQIKIIIFAGKRALNPSINNAEHSAFPPFYFFVRYETNYDESVCCRPALDGEPGSKVRSGYGNG